MEYEQVVQSVLKNSEQLSTFKELHISELVQNIKSDSLYVDCAFTEGIISAHNAHYKLNTVALNGDGSKKPPSKMGGIHMFSKNDMYLCSYVPEFNSLIIKYCPFDEYIPFINEAIKKHLSEQNTEILNTITQSRTVQIAVGSNVWNYKPLNVINTTIWHLTELLRFSYRRDPMLLYDENAYVLKNEGAGSLLDMRFSEVSAKATKLIEKIKKQYAEKVQQLQAQHFKELGTQVSMPNISIEEVINNRLMISKWQSGISYTFVVNIPVSIVLNNNSGKYIQLDEPIELKNQLLVFQVNSNSRISKVRLFNNDLSASRHLHCSHNRDSYGTLCTGTMNIYDINITGVKHLIELKNKVVSVMSAYNIGHCNNRDNFDSLLQKLEQEGIPLKGKHGYIYSTEINKQRNNDNPEKN